jgi:hypothetical protein
VVDTDPEIPQAICDGDDWTSFDRDWTEGQRFSAEKCFSIVDRLQNQYIHSNNEQAIVLTENQTILLSLLEFLYNLIFPWFEPRYRAWLEEELEREVHRKPRPRWVVQGPKFLIGPTFVTYVPTDEVSLFLGEGTRPAGTLKRHDEATMTITLPRPRICKGDGNDVISGDEGRQPVGGFNG